LILYEPSALVVYRDYGIMLPIAPDRGKRVLEYLDINNVINKFSVFDFSSARKYLTEKQNDNDYRGILNTALISRKFLLDRDDLERVHNKNFVERLYSQNVNEALLNTFELIDKDGNLNRYEPEKAARPLSDLFQILLAQAGGTYLACLLALSDNVLPRKPLSEDTNFSVNKKPGFCFYLGGGMHHARSDAPSGFCLINDVTAAAFKIFSEKFARRIWIIDLDAHKGDGSAEIVYLKRTRKEINRRDIMTLSIHMAKGWPLDIENLKSAEEGKAPLLPSDVDIAIEAGEENYYVSRLAEGISRLETLCEGYPDFAVVVDGADPYERDELPSASLLRLTLEQCIERDLYLYNYLQSRNISSAWIQAGGYGERAWEPAAYFLKEISGFV